MTLARLIKISVQGSSLSLPSELIRALELK
jgi:hypothetical protein